MQLYKFVNKHYNYKCSYDINNENWKINNNLY